MAKFPCFLGIFQLCHAKVIHAVRKIFNMGDANKNGALSPNRDQDGKSGNHGDAPR
jgi:hypothetical protein